METRYTRRRVGFAVAVLAALLIGPAQPSAGMPAAGLAAEQGGELRLTDVRGGAAPSLAGPMDGRVFLAQGVRIEAYPARAEDQTIVSVLNRSPILPGLVVDMVAADGLIYANLFDHGLWILEADRLEVLGSIPIPGSHIGLAIQGRFAYVADRTAGLVVVDVSDVRRPRRVTNVPMPDRDLPDNLFDVQDIVHQGSRLLVRYRDAYSFSLVAIFELFDDTPPVARSIVDLMGAEEASGAAACADPPGMILSDYMVHVLDLCDLGKVSLLNRYQPPGEQLVSISSHGHMALVGMDRYDPSVRDQVARLELWRVEPDGAIDVQSELESIRSPEALHLNEDLGLSVDRAADGGLQLRWLKSSFGAPLATDGTTPIFSHSAWDVVSLPDGSWLSTANEALWRLETTPEGLFHEAEVLGSRALRNATATARVGDTVYVRTTDGIVVIDISDPTAPAVISMLDQAPFDHDYVDVASLDSFLITAIADGGASRGQGASFGLHVYGTLDPAQPELMGTYKYEPTGPAHLYEPISVEAALGKALIASRRSIHFVDLDDPSNPMLLDALAYEQEVSAATLDEIGNVFVATVDGIVEVYEISGDRLSQTSRLALGRQPLGLVATDGQLVVVTAGNVTLEGGYHAQAQVFEQGEDGRMQATNAVALPGGVEVEVARAAIARGQMLIAMRGYGVLALGARPVVHEVYLPWLSLP